VDSLIEIHASRYELWKHFEDRADKLGERLWTIGIWLMAIVAATLSLPFVAKLVVVQSTGFPIHVSARFPVALISLFGIVFLLYSFLAVCDIQEHIVKNWDRAIYARNPSSARTNTNDKEKDTDGGNDRRRHGLWVLLAVGFLALAAFAGLLILACIPVQ